VLNLSQRLPSANFRAETVRPGKRGRPIGGNKTCGVSLVERGSNALSPGKVNHLARNLLIGTLNLWKKKLLAPESKPHAKGEASSVTETN
jgi:hypothetical protein